MAAITWDRIEDREAERAATRAALQLVAGPPSRRRPGPAVYRRRRLVALVVALVVAATLLQLASTVIGASASAGTAPSAPVVLVARPGDSYWSLAAKVGTAGDIRSTVDALVDANGGRELRPGDRIRLGG